MLLHPHPILLHVDVVSDCVYITPCSGTTDDGTTARVEVSAANTTADRTCTPCAANFWIPVGDNTNCLRVH